MTERHTVSDTAALVMLWAARYYRNDPLVEAYLERLDLSAGKDLFDRYNRICPWYSEVIINRKHFIYTTVRQLAGRSPGFMTIVNLGAGFSPLALELSPLLSSRCRFIEIDESGMDRKTALYADLVPARCGSISCLTTDITDTSSIRDILEPEERDHLVIVMEGLSYYITRDAMEQVFSTLFGLSGKLTIVFEHLKPCRSIREDRWYIPDEIFSHVRDYTGLDRMTTYTEGEIRAMLPPGSTCRYHNMDVMEMRRTGRNTFFPTPDSGWLSVAIASRTRDGGKEP
jgi:O-methyltransferase involved in polyketide biosynthesis